MERCPELLREPVDDEGKNTPAHYVVASRREVPRELLGLLVGEWPGSLLVANAKGDLPIHAAIMRDEPSTDTVGMLLDLCPESMRVANAKGSNALQIAIAKDKLDVVRFLVERNPELVRERDAFGNTLAHFVAAACGDLSLNLLEFVFEAWPGSIRVRNASGDLPLHLLVAHEKPPSRYTALLLRRHPDAGRVRGSGGKCPLHAAVSVSYPSPNLSNLVRRLLKLWSGAVRVRDADGNPPLIVAAAKENARLDDVFILLKLWPDIVVGGTARSSPPSSVEVGSSAKRPRLPSVG